MIEKIVVRDCTQKFETLESQTIVTVFRGYRYAISMQYLRMLVRIQLCFIYSGFFIKIVFGNVICKQ